MTVVSRPASALNSSWHEDAACRKPGIDPELFFPVGETGPAIPQVRAAKAICAQCPVISECRTYALRVGEPDGIWGGMTTSERRRVRRSPRRHNVA